MFTLCIPVTGVPCLSGALVCFVCLKYNSSLQKCSGCKLLFYCSKEHQKLHWPKHKELCRAVKLIIEKKDGNHLFNEVPADVGIYNYKQVMVNLCEVILKRRTTQSECFLFYKPFICQVCHIYKHNSMIICSNCNTVCYCSEAHKESDRSVHSLICDRFKLCLDYERDCSEGFIINAVLPSIKRLPSSMQSFIDCTKVVTIPSGREKHVGWYLSNILSVPLTIIYVIEKCIDQNKKMKEKLILHIVGSGPFEGSAWMSWEYIFHYFKTLKSLKLVFICPDRFPQDFSFLTPTLGCNDCKRTKNIDFSFENLTYRDYVSKNRDTPDFIFAFHCGFYEYKCVLQNDTWKDSVPSLCSFTGAYFTFTSYGEEEAKQDLEVFRGYVEKNQNLEFVVECKKNQFGSLLPSHDWLNEKYFESYSNNFITIIKS
ncbi:uncharacterized protein LOC142318983 [Lycorma delicatula]|uniref:uncharacterized protein LOC142318983 n=1 Tax=Lycorma delicatula TaxID=130591 RepID=UPI003F513706